MLETIWFNSDVDHFMYAHTDGTTTDAAAPRSQQAPAAPLSVTATYICGTGGRPGHVDVHWVNSSNDETMFEVSRMTPTDLFEDLGMSMADHTEESDNSFTDSSVKDNGPWSYRVQALNGAVPLPSTDSGSVTAIGGPDITAHLLAIRSALFAYAQASPGNKASLASELGSWLNAPDNWDIYALSGHNPYVQAPANDGLLPDGSPTCTVDGSVYYDYEVNYWLYGSWVAAVGADSQGALKTVAYYRTLTNSIEGSRDDLSGKASWFMAGYTGDIGFPTQSAIHGVAPGSGDPGPLHWHIGEQGSSTDLDRSN